ncbi:PREDICTED: homeobox-DDT domain protein RLT3-like isoform X1 [Camelina sativa]|uniref:Homeobox-DDT domain protein RLT3-like isoform X1 n=1 Tax=Camelina sativa TaxID=90675 RepID=A0ABM0V3J7_CAMSA|nr:PREDICTED: homeobox-DDT domain protein RLT3-like isoform X2 [Camelina sativa]XP_019089797.1 PREDICTED: homeobox-DDT domain protein RLT3-like isoform X1 [Camelina sativa]
MKRKSPVQVQALEAFYFEQIYPTPKEMEDMGKSLGLTVKEVRGWFKRRTSRGKGMISPADDVVGAENPQSYNTSRIRTSRCDFRAVVKKISSVETRKANCQELFTSQHILAKIFRKDGPTLGSEFDHPSSGARKASWLGTSSVEQQKQRMTRKRKISELMDHTSQDCVQENATVMKHGIGKGLMTVWRVMNPNRRDVSPCVGLLGERATLPQSSARNPPHQKKKQRQLASILKQKLLQKRSTEKKRRSINREVELNKDETQRAFKEHCDLAVDREVFKETCQTTSILVDDEELEMRERQERGNPLTCSCHHSSSGSHGCFLCKDLLPKFPPNSVQMRVPFGLHPWNSFPETVKKLFKVVHFLYTYSVTLDICPFTLDELTRAFHDKDSLLLGKIHLSLLKLLLLDVETELQRGYFSNLSISCKFLALLQSVESQILILDLWKDSLNSLTWTEILRQILVAAGYGSVKGAVQSEELSKERRLMKKYGLHLGTLKGELFRMLNEQGNNGLKISELANAPEVAVLNLATAQEERENSICSTLASDITLFEKISESTYRVRVNCFSEDLDKSQSDSDASGSVDDESDTCSVSSGDDIEHVSENSALRKVKCRKRRKHKSKMRELCSEIDESHPGEPWLLGLMEGEYSDLSIEEKLDVFVALIELLSSGSTIRMEDLPRAIVDCVPSIYSHGSGGKIKRSSSNQCSYPRGSWVHGGELPGIKALSKSSDSHPVDSSSVVGDFANLAGDNANNVHPMQSVYLGSDRRFNRYWLFLGTCNANDPGHRCVFFESSEDGHWEVINNKEALRVLLSVLDDRGRREARLVESLEKRESFLCQAMLSGQVTQSERSHFTDIVREDSSSPVSDIDNNLCLSEIANDQFSSQHAAIVFEIGSKREKSLLWSLLQEFDEWIWANFNFNLSAVKHRRRSYLDSLIRCKSCHDLYWRDEKHCKICHATFEVDIDVEERYAIHAATCSKKEECDTFPDHKVLSSQLQSLKAAVYAIESAMPEDALIGAWRKSAHRLWAKRLRRSSTVSEITQVIGDFVGAINEDWLWHSSDQGHSNALLGETISCFPSMPQTTSAMALWLVKLDTLIAPYVEKAQPERNQLLCRTRNTSRRASRREL